VPALHTLLWWLKLHVPGQHMIMQQTDGLSRGLTFSNSLSVHSPKEEVLHLLRSVRLVPDLVPWILWQDGQIKTCLLQLLDCLNSWSFAQVAGLCSIWAPPTRMGRADHFCWFLMCGWVEQLLFTEAYFLVPQIFQQHWGSKSKHFCEVGVFNAMKGSRSSIG